MEDLTFDWLYQQERGLWERRVRELKQELATQQKLAAKQKLAVPVSVPVSVEVAPQPVAAKLMQPQQQKFELEEVASPSQSQTRQRLMRLVNYR